MAAGPATGAALPRRWPARRRRASKGAMKILITGGAGFIGSAVIRHLLRHTDAAVVNLDKLTYAANPAAVAEVADDPALGRRYAFEQVDICDPAGVRRVLAAHRPDAIMHLAAESHVDRSIAAPAAFVETNVMGTQVLLDAALEHWRGLPAAGQAAFRFHHVSTDETFGPIAEPAFCDETAPYRPSSPYSASKAASDHLVFAWHRTFGLPAVLSRSSNTYGPWQFPEKLIPVLVLNGLAGKRLPIYGDGLNQRDWLFVEDQARALWTILTRGRIGESYNVSVGAPKTNLEIVRRIAALLDGIDPEGAPHERLIEFVTDRPGHDRRYAMDGGKLRRELGWAPAETLESGLAKTVRWYAERRQALAAVERSASPAG